jgi:hypothetical protein
MLGGGLPVRPGSVFRAAGVGLPKSYMGCVRFLFKCCRPRIQGKHDGQVSGSGSGGWTLPGSAAGSLIAPPLSRLSAAPRGQGSLRGQHGRRNISGLKRSRCKVHSGLNRIFAQPSISSRKLLPTAAGLKAPANEHVRSHMDEDGFQERCFGADSDALAAAEEFAKPECGFIRDQTGRKAGRFVRAYPEASA